LREGHIEEAAKVDRPLAALLDDLAQRGLLEDTLVLWGAEFGRTPVVENGDGRGHHPQAFTMWMAGGGVRHGLTYGSTDEFGYRPIEKPVHMHDLHATLLYILGLDHERLTYRYAGRAFRLTDVYGRVVYDVLA
jgi:arylsulfatase A-like enzyme